MTEAPTENFLNTPSCPFRRVSFGAAHCTLSTDSHVSEVDPLSCHNCDVPRIISQPRCRFLSLGTELKPYRGEGKLVTAMACRALNIKLYSLQTCDICPLCSEVPSLAELIKTSQEHAAIQVPISEALVEEIARDIKLDYGAPAGEAPPLMPVRCWRFPEGYCRKFPVYAERKTTVILRHHDRNNELYRNAIRPALIELQLQPYRMEDELVDEEEMCRVCENMQEGRQVVFNLDDWSANTVFLIGMIYGLGRRIALLKNDSLQPVPLLDYMAHDVVHYTDVAGLKQQLVDHFAPYVKPAEEERG